MPSEELLNSQNIWVLVVIAALVGGTLSALIQAIVSYLARNSERKFQASEEHKKWKRNEISRVEQRLFKYKMEYYLMLTDAISKHSTNTKLHIDLYKEFHRVFNKLCLVVHPDLRKKVNFINEIHIVDEASEKLYLDSIIELANELENDILHHHGYKI